MPDDETNDRSTGPDDGGVEYEYGGGTGDFERGEYNPGEGGLEDTDFEDDGVLDSSDTLEDSEDPYEDPLDQGILPADKWSAGERFGDTLEEEREGESLDQLLAEEEPDVDPYKAPASEGDLPREGPEPFDEPQPRAGWWRRMKAPTPTASRTWWPRTWASTAAPRPRRKPPST